LIDNISILQKQFFRARGRPLFVNVVCQFFILLTWSAENKYFCLFYYLFFYISNGENILNSLLMLSKNFASITGEK